MTTLNLGMFCFSKGVRKISQTIFFSRTPLLRTVAITDPKSAPLPHPPRVFAITKVDCILESVILPINKFD